ncbi:MAG: SIS domain-containing protein [Chloroflexi bacterium]|nr:SIS domain-containing protein [Chloroflexota bacterium]
MSRDEHIATYLNEVGQIAAALDQTQIRAVLEILKGTRARGGRLFFLGVGGSAANASHAVNDFRKLAEIETSAPTDNVSELTARTNDDGFETTFAQWLITSNLGARDTVFILSVGGGNLEKNVSVNIVHALQLAKERGAKIARIVGRDGGYTARVADAPVIVPTVNPSAVTPHSETFQSVLLHLLISHPELQMNVAKWESTR